MTPNDPDLPGEIALARALVERAQAAQAAVDDILRPHQLRARFDDQLISLTPRFVGALIELMRAECAMMDSLPGLAGRWWGRCTIHDLADARGLEFQYGDRASLPADGRDRFAVVVNQEGL